MKNLSHIALFIGFILIAPAIAGQGAPQQGAAEGVMDIALTAGTGYHYFRTIENGRYRSYGLQPVYMLKVRMRTKLWAGLGLGYSTERFHLQGLAAGTYPRAPILQKNFAVVELAPQLGYQPEFH